MDPVLFERVVRFVRLLDKEELPSFLIPLDYNERLKYYALYKQATFGKCNAPRPWFFERQSRYKHDAWFSLGDMSRATAMSQYVEGIVEYIMGLKLTFLKSELAGMDPRDRAALASFGSRVAELKADCALLWPSRYSHLRKPACCELTDDIYGRDEIASYNVKRESAFGSPLVLAEDIGIQLPTNLAGLIGGVSGAGLHSSLATESEADGEDDPLHVKEPRDIAAAEMGARRSPLGSSPSDGDLADTEHDLMHRIAAMQESIDRIERRLAEPSGMVAPGTTARIRRAIYSLAAVGGATLFTYAALYGIRKMRS